jgi:hypothetical protein
MAIASASPYQGYISQDRELLWELLMMSRNTEREWRKDWNETTPEEKQFYFPIITAGMGLVGGLLLGLILFSTPSDRTSYYVNVYTGVLSTLVTIGVIDRLNNRRTRQQLKAQLIREMSSSDNGIARRAVRELRENGAVQDGSLKSAFLAFANLNQANLMWANLASAQLDGAQLQQAWLDNAHLYKASLQQANLDGAVLDCTNLPFANLKGTILHRAHLNNAELVFADFTDAQFDSETLLPDGTYWNHATDMARFTDPEHSYFWRSESPESPAYRNRYSGEPGSN